MKAFSGLPWLASLTPKRRLALIRDTKCKMPVFYTFLIPDQTVTDGVKYFGNKVVYISWLRNETKKKKFWLTRSRDMTILRGLYRHFRPILDA